jgi:glucokinase
LNQPTGARWGAVDIGGTKLLATVAAAPGAAVTAVRRPTPRTDCVDHIIGLLREAGADELDGVAVAVPGPLDRRSGTLMQPPNLSQDWWDLELRSELSDRLDCPVVVENDANCAALAEAVYGAGRTADRVAYMTVSTGIGTGLVDRGVIVESDADSEGGHQVVWPAWLGGPDCRCGARGCLETLASGTAIERRFGVPPAQLTDPGAWADVGRWLGVGLANVAALQRPDVIVVGGGVTHAVARFWPALCSSFAQHCRLRPVPHVKLVELDATRNLVGGLLLCSDRFGAVVGRRSVEAVRVVGRS